MGTQSVAEIYDRVEEFTALLVVAELLASGEWEEHFTSDLRASFQRYGPHTLLSEKQKQILERIASHC